MTSVLRRLTRALIPRQARNWLRSPRQAARWLQNELQGPVEFKVRPDWTLRCPRNAAERAFYLQIQDPPQVEEFDLFLRHLRGAGRVALLDVGCHFGLFCYAALHYGAPGSRALAVDPSKEAEAMVSRIVRMHGWQESVQFIRAAAGARDDTLELVETGVTGAGYMVLPKDHPVGDRQSMPMLTLDSLARRMGAPPTLVKVDVEGFELDVLRGGPVTLGQRKTPLFLEIHNEIIRQRGGDPAEILRELHALGYRSFQVGTRHVEPDQLIACDIIRVLALHEPPP